MMSCLSMLVCVVSAAVRRSGSADRQTSDMSRSRSTSPLRLMAAVTSLSSVDVDPVSVQKALRSFCKQLVTAEKDRVSNIQ